MTIVVILTVFSRRQGERPPGFLLDNTVQVLTRLATIYRQTVVGTRTVTAVLVGHYQQGLVF